MTPHDKHSDIGLEIFEMGMDRLLPSFRDWDEGLVLNLGSGNKKIRSKRSQVVNLDMPDYDANTMSLPYDNGTVDHILAFHFLEHVDRVFWVLQECQRVLKPGGTLNVVVPYGMSDMAIHDLSHKHRFNEDTWKNTFYSTYYDRPDDGVLDPWEFEIGFNMIMGIVHRNLALVTQLIRK